MLNISFGASLSKPYIYVNYQGSGPVPVEGFCRISSLYE